MLKRVTHAISDLSNVDDSGAASGDFLQFNGSEWVDFDLLAAANTWTANQTISNTNPTLTLADTTGGDADWSISADGGSLSIAQDSFDITKSARISAPLRVMPSSYTSSAGAVFYGFNSNITLNDPGTAFLYFGSWTGTVNINGGNSFVPQGFALSPTVNCNSLGTAIGTTFNHGTLWNLATTNPAPSLEVYADVGRVASATGASTGNYWESFSSAPQFSTSGGGSLAYTRYTGLNIEPLSFSVPMTFTDMNGVYFSPVLFGTSMTNMTAFNTNPQLLATTTTNYRHAYFSDVTGPTNVSGIQSVMTSGTGKKFLNHTGTAESLLSGHVTLPDSIKSFYGTGQDASIYYDGTDLNINSMEVGSGVTRLRRRLVLNQDQGTLGTSGPSTLQPGLDHAPVFSTNNNYAIYASFRDSGEITNGSATQFTWTSWLLNPTVISTVATTSATCIGVDLDPYIESATASVGTAGYKGIEHTPQIRADGVAAGTGGNLTGFNMEPTVSAINSGSLTIDQVYGIKSRMIVSATSGASATVNKFVDYQVGAMSAPGILGPTTVTTHYGIEMLDEDDATTFYGIQSSIADGSNRRFISHTGDAPSVFGGDVEIDGALNHDGTTLGFYGTTPTTRATGYTTFANLTTDRTCNANATTVAELADILGTLIEDLKATGIISA